MDKFLPHIFNGFKMKIWLRKLVHQRQHCVTVLQCYSSKIKLWRVKNKLYIYV